MCLIFIALREHPDYKLIVAANRDEFYNRRTAPADYWPDHKNILGGRDLEAGGTWMAMNISGKISMLTNYRDPKNIDPKAPSRGHLVSHFLESDVDAGQYMNEVESKKKLYNGFNLVTGTPDELLYLSNYSDGITRLSAGLHGLSNHLLDSPWPKVVRGKKNIEPILKDKKIEVDSLFEFLYDDKIAADSDLPETGIGLERERALSSMFIKTNNYGSRCSTVVLVTNDNQVTFAERVYDLKTFDFTQNQYRFTIKP